VIFEFGPARIRRISTKCAEFVNPDSIPQLIDDSGPCLLSSSASPIPTLTSRCVLCLRLRRRRPPSPTPVPSHDPARAHRWLLLFLAPPPHIQIRCGAPPIYLRPSNSNARLWWICLRASSLPLFLLRQQDGFHL
jgi:hypothetical protein